jgi:hypothetical protein
MVALNELSTEFDVLYNNITSNQAPGLNGYEKSVFLTKAQSQLIPEYFNARIDSSDGGFDNTQKRQYDFSSIITHQTLSQISPNRRFDPRSVSYNLPPDWMLTLNEQLSVKADANSDEELFTIRPVSFDEYDRLMAKPFKFPIKNQAWRLITNNGTWTETTTETETIEHPNAYVQYLGGKYVNWSVISKTSNAFYLEIRLGMGGDMVYDPTNNLLYVPATFTLKDLVIFIESRITGVTVKILRNTSLEDDIPVLSQISIHPLVEDILFTLFGQGITTLETQVVHTYTGKVVELIGRTGNKTLQNVNSITYRMRYVKVPSPIILEDLTNYGENISIQGQTAPSTLDLPDEFYKEILERAVTLAKISWQGATMTQTALAVQANK